MTTGTLCIVTYHKHLTKSDDFSRDCSILRAPNHHLSEKPADHDGVEADDEEEGQEVAKDEEAHLHMQMR